MQKSDENLAPKTDVVTRYFMRRFALAQKKSRDKRVQYANALAETILVFVAVPFGSILGFGIVTSAKLQPRSLLKLFNTAPEAFALAMGGLVMLLGYLILNRRMKRRLQVDPDCYSYFSTEKDAEIVTIQKTIALIALGIVPAGLGLLVLASW